MLQAPEAVVVQCPAMAYKIHVLGKEKSLAIVYMVRREEDVLASMKRIGWDQTWGKLEELLYETNENIYRSKWKY